MKWHRSFHQQGHRSRSLAHLPAFSRGQWPACAFRGVPTRGGQRDPGGPLWARPRQPPEQRSKWPGARPKAAWETWAASKGHLRPPGPRLEVQRGPAPVRRGAAGCRSVPGGCVAACAAPWCPKAPRGPPGPSGTCPWALGAVLGVFRAGVCPVELRPVAARDRPRPARPPRAGVLCSMRFYNGS